MDLLSQELVAEAQDIMLLVVVEVLVQVDQVEVVMDRLEHQRLLQLLVTELLIQVVEVEEQILQQKDLKQGQVEKV